jgi:hypothetical protein
VNYRTPRVEDNAEDAMGGGEEEDEVVGNITGFRLTMHGLGRGPANTLLWRFARVIQAAIEDEGFVDDAPMPGQPSESVTVTLEFQGGFVDHVDWHSTCEEGPLRMKGTCFIAQVGALGEVGSLAGLCPESEKRMSPRPDVTMLRIATRDLGASFHTFFIHDREIYKGGRKEALRGGHSSSAKHNNRMGGVSETPSPWCGEVAKKMSSLYPLTKVFDCDDVCERRDAVRMGSPFERTSALFSVHFCALLCLFCFSFVFAPTPFFLCLPLSLSLSLSLWGVREMGDGMMT